MDAEQEFLLLLIGLIVNAIVLISQEYIRKGILSNSRKLDYNNNQTDETKVQSSNIHKCLDETKQAVFEIKQILIEGKNVNQ